MWKMKPASYSGTKASVWLRCCVSITVTVNFDLKKELLAVKETHLTIFNFSVSLLLMGLRAPVALLVGQ